MPPTFSGLPGVPESTKVPPVAVVGAVPICTKLLLASRRKMATGRLVLSQGTLYAQVSVFFRPTGSALPSSRTLVAGPIRSMFCGELGVFRMLLKNSNR